VTFDRRSGIGGSDAGACAGLSRFRSRHDVWLERMGLSAPLIETEAMEWGTRLEPVVLRKYVEATGRRVIVRRGKDGEQLTLRHPGYPWMYSHLDAETLRKPKRVVEAKTTGSWHLDDWGEPGTDQVPAEYNLQCQHNMAVTGWDVTDVAVLIAGQRFRLYTVERDEGLIENLIQIEADMWDLVQRGEPPEIDGTDASSRFLAIRFPTDDGTTEDATDAQAELVREYLAASATKARAEEQLTLLTNTIKDGMGSTTVLAGPTFRVTWKDTAGSVSWKSVAERLRVLVESAKWQTAVNDSQTAGSRRFTVSVKGE